MLTSEKTKQVSLFRISVQAFIRIGLLFPL